MNVIFVTLLATSLMQLGYFFWKVSADHQPTIGKVPLLTTIKAQLTDWRWVSGLIALVSGWALFIQATAIGEISLIQPLMSSGDVLLIVLAVVFLKERLNRIETIAICFIILGAVGLAFGESEKKVLYLNNDYLFLLIASVALTSVLLFMLSRRSQRSEFYLAAIVGLGFGLSSVFAETLTTKLIETQNSLYSWEVLLNPWLIGAIVSSCAGLGLLQVAFQRGRASVIVPLQLAVNNAVAVFAGFVIFMDHVTIERAISICIIISGTIMLHRGHSKKSIL